MCHNTSEKRIINMIRKFEFVVLGNLENEDGLGGNYKIILKKDNEVVEESEMFNSIGDCILSLNEFIYNNSNKYGFNYNGGDRVEVTMKDCIICYA
jgi:hypothetical protein